MLPTGGATGQVLTKASNDDFEAAWMFPSLSFLDDVDLDAPEAGDLLKWDAGAGKWINARAAFGELSGALSTAQFPATVTVIDDADGTVTIDTAAGVVFRITAVGDITLQVNEFRAGAPLLLVFEPTLMAYSITFHADSFAATGALETAAGSAFTALFWCDGSRFWEVSRSGPIGV
jgi:hypothetical protein